MADESNAPAVADATKSVDEPAPAAEPVAQPVVAEAKPAEGGPVATESVAEGECQRAHKYTIKACLTVF